MVVVVVVVVGVGTMNRGSTNTSVAPVWVQGMRKVPAFS